MQLEEVQGKSKKGNPWTGYRIKIGKYLTPLFFPSEIEADYIKEYIRKDEHKAFTDER